MLDTPFQLAIPPGTLIRRASFAIARPFLSQVLGAPTLAALYARRHEWPAGAFEERALRLLDITVDANQSEIARVPASGAVIVAANHPNGALDGLVLAHVLRRVRDDVRIVVNRLLERIPELHESCFFVDPFDGPLAAARSRAGLRAAHLWLKRGGAILMFPSGEVAPACGEGDVAVDAAWRDTLGRLAISTGAQVVPAFIRGTNSRLFYAAGRLHPALRTLLLGRELLRRRGTRVTVHIGQPLRAGASAVDAVPAALTLRVRAASDALSCQPAAAAGAATPLCDTLAGELARLPGAACLIESGRYQVFCTEAAPIPLTLEEIGRLRAIAYRAVGEGPAHDRDLDRFDEHYLHLFSWDRTAGQVVGAYRIGRVDRILATEGVDGLYTRTLFRYEHALLDRLSPALELGRSFVRPEYQRSHNALNLLWKGIGRFVARHPEYRHLFGLVSISARYSDASHGMLMAFLEQNHLDASLAELAHALTPARGTPQGMPVPQTLDGADAAIRQLEADGKPMPVLLRQYLRLNARLIGFNVDAGFGDALDALMTVDLARVAPAILTRYLGRDGAAVFAARHGVASSLAA